MDSADELKVVARILSFCCSFVFLGGIFLSPLCAMGENTTQAFLLHVVVAAGCTEGLLLEENQCIYIYIYIYIIIYPESFAQPPC